MGKSYLKGASFFFPNADVIIDSFHVIQAANKMVDEVRKKTGFEGKDGKIIRFKLLSNAEDLAEEGGEAWSTPYSRTTPTSVQPT